jgi:glycyl-tRNA synthetase alpha chain
MYIQGVDSMFDIEWVDGVTYGDVFMRDEQQYSAYNFEVADTDMLRRNFDVFEGECRRVLDAGLPLPAYDYVLKCSHAFNLLDARGAIAVTERMGFILRVRALAKACCAAYIDAVRGPAAGATETDAALSEGGAR